MHNKTFLSSVDAERKRLNPNKIELSVIGDARKLRDELEEFIDEKGSDANAFNKGVSDLKGVANIIDSIIDDVVEKFNQAEKALNNLRELYSDSEKNISAAGVLSKNTENQLSKLEKAADDLGVKVDNIDVYDEIVKLDNKLEGLIDFYSNQVDDGRDAIDRVIEASRKINKIPTIQ